MNKRLVADVGGTNTRIALWDEDLSEFRALQTFVNRDYQQFEDVIAHWLDQLTEPAPETGCIAIAAVPADGRVEMSNMSWSFSQSDLAQRFGLARFNCINDFAAIAHALPFLKASDRHVLHRGQPGSNGKLAAVGPGTGLGGSSIEQLDGNFHVTACEPGHTGLSPASELEIELFRLLLTRHGSIYAELLTSGPGLQRLYDALCELRGLQPSAISPAQVSASALRGDDQQSLDALGLFCALLGSACGDFVVANGNYGGLFLAGGIVPDMIPFLEASDFHRRLCDKGAMKAHLQKLPVFVITAAQPGLIGAARAPI